MSIELSSVDRPLLERLIDLVPYHSSISDRARATNFASTSATSNWRCYAAALRGELVAAGMPVGKKSVVVAPPSTSFSEVDYLRGLLDGDGSVGFTAKNFPFVAFTTASDHLAEFFLASCVDLPGRPQTARRNKRDQVYSLIATRECAAELARRVWYPGALSLPRKQAAAASAGEWLRPDTMPLGPPRPAPHRLDR